MLPTIVIGADEATREPLRAKWREATKAGELGLTFFDTTVEAAYAMTDELERAQNTAEAQAEGEHTMGSDMPMWEQNPDGSWAVNILWGPNAWGPALVGNKPELAHTGWTAVFGAEINDQPGKPRRVRDGEAEGADPDTRVWQAAPIMRAQVAFDVLGKDGTGRTAVQAVVDRFASRETP